MRWLWMGLRHRLSFINVTQAYKYKTVAKSHGLQACSNRRRRQGAYRCQWRRY